MLKLQGLAPDVMRWTKDPMCCKHATNSVWKRDMHICTTCMVNACATAVDVMSTELCCAFFRFKMNFNGTRFKGFGK